MNTKARVALGSAALAIALLTAGCTAAPDTTTDEGPTDLTPAAQAAQDIVDQATQPVTEFVAPGPAVDASSIEGGTVYFIVPATEAEIFHAIERYLSEALGEVGLDVQACGTSAGTPEGIATCLGQAIDANAVAVISAGTPNVMAPTAYAQVVDAGIPVLYTLAEPTGPGDPTKVGYLTPNMIGLQAWNANWIIADSNGEANVLVGRETANPVLASWTDVGTLATFEEGCPDCTVKAADMSLPFIDKVPTDVSTALVSDPDIGYVQSPFDSHVQAIIQGIQGASRTPNDIKVASTDASFAVVQQLSQGQFIGSASGFSMRAFSWYAADEVIRMLSGNSSIQEDAFPYMRLFTADNVGDLEITEEAWADGSWYGATDFPEKFLELWGVN